MAETKVQGLLATLSTIVNKGKNPDTDNYKSQSPNPAIESLPHLSSSAAISNKKCSTYQNNSLDYFPYSDKISNRNPNPMTEDPKKVVRSVVAGRLLRLHEESSNSFDQTDSGSVLADLEHYRMMSPLEKEALAVLGGGSSTEWMISAINSVLLSIQEETGGVNCRFTPCFMGSPRVIIMSINPRILAQELLPSLVLHHLSLDNLPHLDEEEHLDKEEEREQHALEDSKRNYIHYEKTCKEMEELKASRVQIHQ